ncbi:MAG: NAD-dependent epimerase/dehydratase family protein [Anaerolineae bacterium]|nr:NAD-dependent epimerase/dehydratase family protein [Anaerolineae bacterium]
MKALFIGGTGVISSACARLALDRGIDLYLLNRGQSTRPVPDGAIVLTGDIHDEASLQAALGSHHFDVIVDWIAYTPDHIEADIRRFAGRTGQYVFISTASVYHKPVISLPITESTPLHNPFWQYSRDKIACEERLIRAYRETGFPVTIVRPSHTYDQTKLPLTGGYTIVDRMRKGRPIVVHGDGTSLWVLTHHTDFAKAFIGLMGRSQAVGEAYHITGDEVLTWNQIAQAIARAAGAKAEIVHAASETIASYDPDWGANLLGDKSHSVIFDNTKIKRLVPDYQAVIPFERGVEEVIAWYDADPARQQVDEAFNSLLDTIIAAQGRAMSGQAGAFSDPVYM